MQAADLQQSSALIKQRWRRWAQDWCIAGLYNGGGHEWCIKSDRGDSQRRENDVVHYLRIKG
jgi:hypothetical protein